MYLRANIYSVRVVIEAAHAERQQFMMSICALKFGVEHAGHHLGAGGLFFLSPKQSALLGLDVLAWLASFSPLEDASK